MSKKNHKQLYHDAEKFLDLGAMFRGGKPKIGELTSYKVKKITATLNKVYAMAGSKHYAERDFVPIRKSKRRAAYAVSSGMPPYFKGAFINGGAKHNKGVTITKDLTLAYKRGELSYKSAPIDATNSETLKAGIESHRETIEAAEHTYIGTNGNFIRPLYRKGRAPTDEILEKALFLMEKYNGMAARGEHRTTTDKFGREVSKGVAQTMDKWGFCLLWTEAEKAKNAKK